MSNAIMAILFEGKKDLVDDVRLDKAEVIAAAAVDAASGEETVQPRPSDGHHQRQGYFYGDTK